MTPISVTTTDVVDVYVSFLLEKGSRKPALSLRYVELVLFLTNLGRLVSPVFGRRDFPTCTIFCLPSSRVNPSLCTKVDRCRQFLRLVSITEAAALTVVLADGRNQPYPAPRWCFCGHHFYQWIYIVCKRCTESNTTGRSFISLDVMLSYCRSRFN